MSDIEKRIARWRNELARSEAFARADIDELEIHLRDEMEHLCRSGLSEEEALLIASRRLGDTAALADEFGKVNEGRRLVDRLSWMAVGVLLYVIAGYVATGVSQGGILAARLFGLEGYELGAFGIALKVAVIAASVILAWIVYRRWSRHPDAELPPLSTSRLVLLFAALALLDLALIGSQVLFRAATARSLGAVEYGHVAIVSGYAGLAWSILAPILVAALIVVLQACAHRRVGCVGGPSEA